PLADNLVRDARVCEGRQGRLLLPERAEVQNEVRDLRLQRQGKARRRHHVAERLRADEVDSRRRGKDRRAREESGAGLRATQFADAAASASPCMPTATLLESPRASRRRYRGAQCTFRYLEPSLQLALPRPRGHVADRLP